MASLFSSLAASPSAPAVGEALSGIFGSISLTAWICLLLPQLITNYRAQSADGLSMAFLFVWLFGDLTNLSGALFTNLAPTAIALASYFCIADVVLISQCTYYNTLNARRRSRRQQELEQQEQGADPSDRSHKWDSSAPNGVAGEDGNRPAAYEENAAATEESPLLSPPRRSSSTSGPRRHSQHHGRRHSDRQHSDGGLEDTLERIVTSESQPGGRGRWASNVLSLVAIYAVGTLGWFISWRMGAWEADPDVPDPDGAAEPTAVAGMVLGYLSAICYLCARVPQIIKNYRQKSCEGLSLLFFLLSLTGNFTYGASLLSFSQKPDYVLRALPWLLGSLGTITEDSIIFLQFRLYGS